MNDFNVQVGQWVSDRPEESSVVKDLTQLFNLDRDFKIAYATAVFSVFGKQSNFSYNEHDA